ncbi:MAG: methyltransferase domain-containing protein [Actinobacteria bacterium]|nr:methyltransferase domain-containing protein [Actinomycetota bacterium]
MAGGSDFYEKAYASVETDPQRRVRLETYDEDLGQAGWLQAAEAREFASWLGTDLTSILDVACGSGGISALLARETGTAVTGVDNDPRAIEAAIARGTPRCTFQVTDANEPLLFDDGSFDAVFSNDSAHHLRDRAAALRDWARLLRPGGRVLYTEGLVLTGPISNDEIARRTFMGFFVLTPVGGNERAIEEAGLILERAEDRSDAVSSAGAGMREARDRYRDEIVPLEGEETFERFQDFLEVAAHLAAERRLSRWVYLARKR